jgi:Holliday junction resolvasome RuvABC endonuclease subunit
VRFWDFLDGFKGEIDVIVYEEVRSSRHFAALKVLAQYEGVLLLWALKNDVPVRGYTPSQLKRRVTGHGRANKDEMILAAETRGHTIKKMGKKQEKSSDHADALLLLELGKEDLI